VLTADTETEGREGIMETWKIFSFAKFNNKQGSKEQHNNTRAKGRLPIYHWDPIHSGRVNAFSVNLTISLAYNP